MAHPLVEALYIGLFASGVAQPVDTLPQTVAEKPAQSQHVSQPARAPRVVYDWAAGTRSVYRRQAAGIPSDAAQVGITEWQVQRIVGPAAG